MERREKVGSRVRAEAGFCLDIGSGKSQSPVMEELMKKVRDSVKEKLNEVTCIVKVKVWLSGRSEALMVRLLLL